MAKLLYHISNEVNGNGERSEVKRSIASLGEVLHFCWDVWQLTMRKACQSYQHLR